MYKYIQVYTYIYIFNVHKCMSKQTADIHRRTKHIISYNDKSLSIYIEIRTDFYLFGMEYMYMNMYICII